MISKTPWTIEDSAKIISADGDIVAEDYTFKNMDDFEAIPEAVNNSKRAAGWAKSDSSNVLASGEGGGKGGPQNAGAEITISRKRSYDGEGEIWGSFWKCSNCGYPELNADGSNYCPKCGVKLNWVE